MFEIMWVANCMFEYKDISESMYKDLVDRPFQKNIIF